MIIALSANAQKAKVIDVDFREIITIPACDNIENKAECLYNFIQEEVLKILKDEIRTKIRKDSIWVGLSFSVDKKGRLESNVSVSVNTKKGPQIKARVRNFIDKLNPFELLTKKPKKAVIRHLMVFRYAYTWENEGVYRHFQNDQEIYTGGTHYEWVGTASEKSKNPRTRKSNLVEEIRSYVVSNFLYINFIKEFNLQGRFRLHLTFGKNGSVQQFHTNSRLTDILEDEFYRIFKNMPSIQPTKINGEPQRTVLSIPFNIK